MGIVFKREFRSHMTDILGAIFISVSIAVMGFFLLFTNLLNSVPQVEYGLLGSVIAFIITIPFLCMSSFKSKKGDGRLKLMMSLPIKIRDVIIGKYLALVCMLAIPTAVLAVFPLILSMFGGIILFSQSYASILAYFLLGASLIAICMFLNIQIKHSPGSLSSGILLFLVLYTTPTLIGFLPKTAIVYLVCLLAFEFIIALLILIKTKKPLMGGIALTVMALPTLIYFFLQRVDFPSMFLRLWSFISPFERFRVFLQGIFKLSDIVYFLSIISLFLLLTYISAEKVRFGDVKITKKDPLPVRQRHFGVIKRSLVRNTLCILLVIVLNIGTLFIPAGFVTADASGLEAYSMSVKSEAFTDKIDEDVTIYLLCEDGIPDAPTETLLQKYNARNSHIKYKKVNVTATPEFLVEYAGIAYNKTNDSGIPPLNNNSIIVTSAKRYLIVDSATFYHYRVGNQSYSESEFMSYCEQLASNGYAISALEYSTFFDLDRIVSSSLEYVTLDAVNTVFTLTGHGEKPISEHFYDNLKYASIENDSIELNDIDKIPENCAALVICSPETDLEKREADMIIKYLESGGDVVLITSPENTGMTNLMSIAQKCGLVATHGTIKEKDAAFFPEGGDPMHLLLQTNPGHQVVSFIKSQYSSDDKSTPLFPNAHAIEQFGTIPENAKITDMFASSEKSVLTLNDAEATTAQAYCTASSYQNRLESGETANLTWFSSYDAFTQKYVDENPVNMVYLLTTISYIGAADTFETSLKIDSRNISGSFLEIEKHVPIIWGGLFLVIIPLTVLGAGIAVYVARRTRKPRRTF